jgi:hypothetical protein
MMEETLAWWNVWCKIRRSGFGKLWPVSHWSFDARAKAWSRDSRLIH